MAIVKYITPDNTEHEIDVPIGGTLMQSAVDNDIDGIDALCGGMCSCGTCHIYVSQPFFDKLKAADDMESEILEMAHEPQDNSRLSCQVTMTAELEGMTVTIAELL